MRGVGAWVLSLLLGSTLGLAGCTTPLSASCGSETKNDSLYRGSHLVGAASEISHDASGRPTFMWTQKTDRVCTGSPVSALVIFTAMDFVDEVACQPLDIVPRAEYMVGHDNPTHEIPLGVVQDQNRTGWSGTGPVYFIEDPSADTETLWVTLQVTMHPRDSEATEVSCAQSAFVNAEILTTYHEAQ